MEELELFYNIDLKKIDGQEIKVKEFKDKTILVVNTASKCGFTYQYDDLEKLYQKFKEKDFVILGFPCNQFANQEPGDNKDIESFCQVKKISFPIFAKIDVNGKNQHPLYAFLKKNAGGVFSNDIKWNFTKFLLNKDLSFIKRYGSSTKIDTIEKELIKLYPS